MGWMTNEHSGNVDHKTGPCGLQSLPYPSPEDGRRSIWVVTEAVGQS